MSIAIPVRSDHDVQISVMEELDWTPDVDGTGIGVAVDDGTVSLSGEVDSNSERIAAGHAALRVNGVIALVDNLIVHTSTRWRLTEADIAKVVVHALTWASNVPDTVKASITNHTVTLSGHVQWDFERRAAERAVQHLRGISFVYNKITLLDRPYATDTEERIRKALTRNAALGAQTIDAVVAGNTVTLSGTTRSWAEKQQAGFAAWSSPHVTNVVNHIAVRGH